MTTDIRYQFNPSDLRTACAMLAEKHPDSPAADVVAHAGWGNMNASMSGKAARSIINGSLYHMGEELDPAETYDSPEMQAARRGIAHALRVGDEQSRAACAEVAASLLSKPEIGEGTRSRPALLAALLTVSAGDASELARVAHLGVEARQACVETGRLVETEAESVAAILAPLVDRLALAAVDDEAPGS